MPASTLESEIHIPNSKGLFSQPDRTDRIESARNYFNGFVNSEHFFRYLDCLGYNEVARNHVKRAFDKIDGFGIMLSDRGLVYTKNEVQVMVDSPLPDAAALTVYSSSRITDVRNIYDRFNYLARFVAFDKSFALDGFQDFGRTAYFGDEPPKYPNTGVNWVLSKFGWAAVYDTRIDGCKIYTDISGLETRSDVWRDLSYPPDNNTSLAGRSLNPG